MYYTMYMEYDDKITEIREKNANKDAHYYGDTVRSLYMAMAVIMLVMTPVFKDEIVFPSFLSILGVLLLSLVAGLTSPKLRSVIIVDFLIGVGAFLVFGYQVVTLSQTFTDAFFLTNLALAIISLFALYFCAKTLRGAVAKQQ